LRSLEPSLGAGYAGAIHWIDPASVADPGALTKGYTQLFLREGGTFARGDACTLGPVTARLLAEQIVGETPFTDPAPYSPQRFA